MQQTNEHSESNYYQTTQRTVINLVTEIKNFEKFGWCFNNQGCLLNYPLYAECKKNAAIRCYSKTICYFCHRCCECEGFAEEIICECDSCEKTKFPCQHSKFHCSCYLCKKIPDRAAIPKELYIFKRVDLYSRGFDIKLRGEHCLIGFHCKISAKYLRNEIYGASAIATHFSQERFSEEHLKNIEKTFNVKKLLQEKPPPNLNENLHQWKIHAEITKCVQEFRNKYHRFPPCFRERNDIRAITKVRKLKN
jgi:hypothetical protein